MECSRKVAPIPVGDDISVIMNGMTSTMLGYKILYMSVQLLQVSYRCMTTKPSPIKGSKLIHRKSTHNTVCCAKNSDGSLPRHDPKIWHICSCSIHLQQARVWLNPSTCFKHSDIISAQGRLMDCLFVLQHYSPHITAAAQSMLSKRSYA